jgi:hypothetical protein
LFDAARRSFRMIDALKRELAAVLIEEHGQGALAVAMAQTRRYRAAGDAAALATWESIGDLVKAMLDQRNPPRRQGKLGSVTPLLRSR